MKQIHWKRSAAVLGLTLALTVPGALAANPNVTPCTGVPPVPIGTVVDHVLYTDIVASIDTLPIPSYNVSGNTVVAAEDLLNYGFDVVWNSKDRTLRISLSAAGKEATANYVPEENTHTIGAIAGDVLATDIVTSVTDRQGRTYEIPSWNIGGITVVEMNDLANAYAQNYRWDQGTRTLSLDVERNAAPIQWTETSVTDANGAITETFTSELATVRYTDQPGLHGGSVTLSVVWPDGTEREYLSELPELGLFAMNHSYYAKDIHVEGASLTFQCPVYELHDPDGDPYSSNYQLEDKGMGLYRVNLRTGNMILESMVEEAIYERNPLVEIAEEAIQSWPENTESCQVLNLGLADVYVLRWKTDSIYPARWDLYVIWSDGLGKDFLQDIPSYGEYILDAYSVDHITPNADGTSFTFECPVYEQVPLESEEFDWFHSKYLGIGTYRIDLLTREMTLESVATD